MCKILLENVLERAKSQDVGSSPALKDDTDNQKDVISISFQCSTAVFLPKTDTGNLHTPKLARLQRVPKLRVVNRLL